MKNGIETPNVTPAMTSKNPYPYPKVIPASHIDGEEGKRIVGNIVREANIKSPSCSLLNESLCQLIKGMISWKEKSTLRLVNIRNTKERNDGHMLQN